MTNLKKAIKENNLKNCYLFFGEENYLKEYYEKQVTSLFEDSISGNMNISIFNEKASLNDIFDAIETLPFFAEKRLVLIKDSKLFKTGRKNDSERLTEALPTFPETTCVVFIENEVDKRGKLYKTLDKTGEAIEFQSPKESDLVKWIQKEFKKNNISIATNTTIYFLRYVGIKMENLNTEILKLSSYLDSGSEITIDDISEICTKSLEAKIFELVDCIGKRETEKAIILYKNMLTLKESPMQILAMISRQFRIMLQCKDLDERGDGIGIISKKLDIKEFRAKEFLFQSKNFTINTLQEALKETLDANINIKTGKMTEELAVELIIIKYSN